MVRRERLCDQAVAIAAATNDVARLDLEEIGEVAAHDDLEVELDLGHAVVEHVEILVNPSADGPADQQSKGSGRDLADLGVERPVSEENAIGVVGDVAAVQEIPRLAVGEDLPRRDYPGVRMVEALVRRPPNLTVRLGDEHAVALVDRKPRRSDCDLERHDFLSLEREMIFAGAAGGRRGNA